MTCAKCEVDVLKVEWDSHNLRKHNYMSWKKDDEPIVNIRLI